MKIEFDFETKYVIKLRTLAHKHMAGRASSDQCINENYGHTDRHTKT